MTAWKLREYVSALLVVVGALGFLSGLFYTFGGDRLPLRSIEFPLGDVQDIAVDRDGNIILALGFYGRIQRYDSAGRFQCGWPAEARGGPFTVAARDGGVVASDAARRRSTVLLDVTGNRLSETTGDPLPTEGDRSLSVDAPDGSTLRLRHRFLWPTIVREKDGVTSTVVSSPWYLRPAAGPLPAWLLLFLGSVLSRPR